MIPKEKNFTIIETEKFDFILIFNSFYLTGLFKSWSEIWHIYPFNVIAKKNVAKVVYSILTR